jgi:hypothetical protein
MRGLLLAVVFLLLLVATLPVLLFASEKNEDFPLQVHIVRVDMAQGQTGVSGSGSTDSNGNYSSHVSGGESYLYHVYTVHVDGDPRELTMTTPAGHYKGGPGARVGDSDNGLECYSHWETQLLVAPG